MNRKWIWLAAIGIVSVLAGIIVYGLETDRSFLSTLAGAVIPLVLGWLLPKSKDTESAWSAENEKGQPAKTVDALVARLGEPDDIILLNAARGNDAESAVLAYDARGVLVIGGKEVKKSDIIDVTFNNAAIPYMPSDYQVVLTTRHPQQPELCLHVGSDVEWARQVAEEIRRSIGI